MESSKTHKKKKPLKSRINLDKLAENINNFNFEVDDFKKILTQYSIPGFNENDNNSEVTDVIHALKSKSHKRKLRKKTESTVDKVTLDNFFNSVINNIETKNKLEESEQGKTHKKVKFVDEKSFEISIPPKPLTLTMTPSSTCIKPKPIHLKKNTLDSLIENVGKYPMNVERPNEKQTPKNRILYNPDPSINIREYVSHSLNHQHQHQHPQHPQHQHQHPQHQHHQPLKDESNKVKVIRLHGDNVFLDDMEENEKESEKNIEDNDNDKDNVKDKDKGKDVKPKKPHLTKEELYQETLANQISLIESKIKEYDDYFSKLPPNHPILLQLRIDIIKDKKKLQDLLPEQPNKLKEKMKYKGKDQEKSNIIIPRKDIDIDIDTEDLPVNDITDVLIGGGGGGSSRGGNYKLKEEEKKKKKDDEHLVFRYDPKVAERDYQQWIKNNSKTPIKSLKAPKKGLLNNQRPPNMLGKEGQHPSLSKKINKTTEIKENQSKSVIGIPRFPSNTDYIKKPIPLKKHVNEIKSVYYDTDEEDFPLPQKKVTVKETNNKTCEINITDKIISMEETDTQKPISQSKSIIENQVPPINPNRNDKVFKKGKTMINPNKFKNKPIKGGGSGSKFFYSEDMEKYPTQWDSINCNEDDNIVTHVKPVKLTQKKVKDFLVKERITNENKNIPSNLMNFLYSSITENSYQVNFIDVLN